MFDSKGRNIHYLRLSVTDLCNLRCRYCMPDGVDKLEREDILTYEEFLRLAALFARCGVDTVRVTGGEPLVRKGVEQLVKGLKAIPGIRKVTMTTNAVLLEQQLPALLEAGLDSVNISLDTLDPALFAKITARDEFAAVQAGIHAALESGIPVKLNCVPQVGVNEGELEALAALAQDKPLQVRFIEMMPIGYGAAMPCISGPELLARFRRRWPELAPLPGTSKICTAFSSMVCGWCSVRKIIKSSDGRELKTAKLTENYKKSWGILSESRGRAWGMPRKPVRQFLIMQRNENFAVIYFYAVIKKIFRQSVSHKSWDLQFMRRILTE